MKTTKLHLSWRDRSRIGGFRTGVSLHSHTQHSRESLAFISKYTAKVPVLSQAIRQQARRYHACTGRALDFGRAWWTPPLSAREAHDLERKQIEDHLGRNALVSLTDHDDIEAGCALAVVEPVPISVEWTVPFGPTFFHLGVHHLPAQRARAIMSDFAAFTANPARHNLADLLAALNECEDTLLVLNHPLWDEPGIGEAGHAAALGDFLRRYGSFLHAFELNGLRSWKENAAVTHLARHTGHPLISGGDRHGCEPNTILNLTNVATFAEFVSEIRNDRASDILFMPQYREPLRLRVIETMWDIVRDYPERPEGRRNWRDCVFYQWEDGLIQPLSQIWRGAEPWPVRYFLHSLRLAKWNPLRNVLRLALGDAQEVSL